MELKNVNKSYVKGNRSIVIFKDLNIKFCPGNFYAITGKSGTGKSTLISILGLLDSYQNGEYLIDGVSTGKLNDSKLSNLRMKKIGLIFQDYYLNPRLTAYENVLIATLINPLIEPSKREKVVLNYLKKLNIYDRRNHYPSELSGGEQQRVCIARALVNNPSYILADEPTGSLDPDNAKIIMNILRKLCDEGKCVIMVTHDMSLVPYADYLYKLENHTLKECK